MTELTAKRERLLESIRQCGSCAVAFSGGVDSAVVAKAAQLALGERAMAVTGVSPSLAEGELQVARDVAAVIGIRHEVLRTQEFANPDYVRNAADRCYHCKSELYSQLESFLERLEQWKVRVLLNGANVDDLGDYRPGMLAAGEHRVRSPLAECELTKAEVRSLAQDWELPVWDKPASPCLSSRVAYGEQVTPERLRMIDRAEQFLRSWGIDPVRVRYHRGDVARVEVPEEFLGFLLEPDRRAEMVAEFRRWGFRFVTLDLEGFRSGSLNQMVSLDEIRRKP